MAKRAETETREEYRYEFSGGKLCLDLANTVSGRSGDSPVEHFRSFADLVSWARQAGLVSAAAGKRLLTIARKHPSKADEVLERAVDLREATYRTFSALAGGRSPLRADIGTLNESLSLALPHLRVVRSDGGYSWGWAEEEALDRMLWPAARSAGELLCSSDVSSLRECALDSCSWLFMDTSRNQSRRWCSMQVCGNRSKVRSHYARKRRRRPSP